MQIRRIEVMKYTRKFAAMAFGLLAALAPLGATTAADLPKVRVIATGGTIAGAQAKPGDYGYKSGAYDVNTLISAVPNLDKLASITGEQVVNIGSQDMNDEVWLKLAKSVAAAQASNDVDAIVIMHGTDTLEETSYFLSLVTQGRKPVVIVGTVRNLSSEHIQTEPFTKDLERELINSGRLTFVANPLERGELRQERQEQQTWAREETQKRLAAETGADYMLQGGIKTIIDQEGREQVKFYQVDLELVQLETNEKAWIGSKKIKKYVKKSRLSW